MSNPDTLRDSVIRCCAALGADPLFVQGAGGNVSWKDGDSLWIKASGTWLAEAVDKDIFVPVDLPHLRSAMDQGDFSVTPRTVAQSALRPSIETLLHALMPHRVVMHLHAIEILAHLVRADARREFESLLGGSSGWVHVGYHKPGAELAEAVDKTLRTAKGADIVFLQNHGVVIGASSVQEADHLLKELSAALKNVPLERKPAVAAATPFEVDAQTLYQPIFDPELNELATDARLFSRLASDWALYPDHVVFLGAFPYTYPSLEAALHELREARHKPDLIFIQDIGAFTTPLFGIAKQVQLRCYFDVMVRQQPQHRLHALDHDQIGELLNWDAEQYRAQLAKK